MSADTIIARLEGRHPCTMPGCGGIAAMTLARFGEHNNGEYSELLYQCGSCGFFWNQDGTPWQGPCEACKARSGRVEDAAGILLCHECDPTYVDVADEPEVMCEPCGVEPAVGADAEGTRLCRPCIDELNAEPSSSEGSDR